MALFYIAATAVIIGGFIVACLISFRAGVIATAKKDVREGLRPLRLSKEDAILYRKGARILNRLINVTDLDGDVAADIVSDQTRKAIEVWLIEYKKELDKA